MIINGWTMFIKNLTNYSKNLCPHSFLCEIIRSNFIFPSLSELNSFAESVSM